MDVSVATSDFMLMANMVVPLITKLTLQVETDTLFKISVSFLEATLPWHNLQSWNNLINYVAV